MLQKSSSWLKLSGIVIFLIVLLTLRFSNQPLNPASSQTASSSAISVASPLPSPSPSPTPTPTPTPSPTPSPSPLPLSSPTPTPSPSPSSQPEFTGEQIHGFFDQFAREYHVDVNILKHIAVCESGFNPQAQYLSYAGLFQFSPHTWTFYRQLISQDPNPDLRFHAQEAVRTAAYILSINHAYIWPNCVPH